jgi:nitrogen regulatory protein P-II 1
MKKVEAIILPSQVEEVRDALIQERGLDGFTMSEVWGVGPGLGHTALYRGSEYHVDSAPRVKVEVVVRDEWAMEGVYAIVDAARAGCPFDLRVLVVPVADAVRVRTGEHGIAAIDGAAHELAAEDEARAMPQMAVGFGRVAAHG